MAGLNSIRATPHHARMLTQDLFASPSRAPEVEAAVLSMAGHDETERGAIFTRPDAVTPILDLSGYRSHRPLHRLRLPEPAFGAGDFLLPVVERLLLAYAQSGGTTGRASIDHQSASRAFR